MVIPAAKLFCARRRTAAMLMTELMVAIAFLSIAVLPLALSFAKEHQYLRNCYRHAVAMEMVDGEMELLVAGEWQRYPNGQHVLTPTGLAVTNLPPGTLQLTVNEKHLRLEWQPAGRNQGGSVTREATHK
jgi:hypothetical protein